MILFWGIAGIPCYFIALKSFHFNGLSDSWQIIVMFVTVAFHMAGIVGILFVSKLEDYSRLYIEKKEILEKHIADYEKARKALVEYIIKNFDANFL